MKDNHCCKNKCKYLVIVSGSCDRNSALSLVGVKLHHIYCRTLLIYRLNTHVLFLITRKYYINAIKIHF